MARPSPVMSRRSLADGREIIYFDSEPVPRTAADTRICLGPVRIPRRVSIRCSASGW